MDDNDLECLAKYVEMVKAACANETARPKLVKVEWKDVSQGDDAVVRPNLTIEFFGVPTAEEE